VVFAPRGSTPYAAPLERDGAENIALLQTFRSSGAKPPCCYGSVLTNYRLPIAQQLPKTKNQKPKIKNQKLKTKN
jgi:hypothetical protein